MLPLVLLSSLSMSPFSSFHPISIPILSYLAHPS
jgi:hypothetical protein